MAMTGWVVWPRDEFLPIKLVAVHEIEEKDRRYTPEGAFRQPLAKGAAVVMGKYTRRGFTPLRWAFIDIYHEFVIKELRRVLYKSDAPAKPKKEAAKILEAVESLLAGEISEKDAIAVLEANSRRWPAKLSGAITAMTHLIQSPFNPLRLRNALGTLWNEYDRRNACMAELFMKHSHKIKKLRKGADQ